MNEQKYIDALIKQIEARDNLIESLQETISVYEKMNESLKGIKSLTPDQQVYSVRNELLPQI